MFTKLKSLLSTGASRSGDDSHACKKQGDEHLKHDRLAEAAECYRRALSMDPDHVDALVAMGFVLSESRQFREAERNLRHALAIDPEIADAHYILGTIAKNEGDAAGSIDQYARALELKPDFEFAHRDLIAALVQTGQRQKAREALDRAISAFPASAEFRFYLGNLLGSEGDNDAAIACYRQALTIQPGSAETHKNLADVLRKCGKPDEAIGAYRKALWFAPNFVDAHIELGNVLRSRGSIDEALACFEHAVSLAPDDAGAHLLLGDVLLGRGRSDEAIAAFRRAVTIDPGRSAAHQYLGNALLDRGATQEAIACYEEVVRLDPENPVKHLIAALSGRDSERAPSDYVERLFDQYAEKFDSHLVEVLSYSVPDKLADLLRPQFASDGRKPIVLDLGCGTGLSGVAIAPFARHLVGVDLSAKMLEKARERNLYQRLEHSDLLAMMRAEASSGYDLVFAADVFVYLGKLDELVDQAHRLLRPGGLLAFSVESLDALADDAAPADGKDYQLNVTGRYAHSVAYLARLATDSGFEVLHTAGTHSRLDKGKPVQGYLVLWRRPPGSG